MPIKFLSIWVNQADTSSPDCSQNLASVNIGRDWPKLKINKKLKVKNIKLLVRIISMGDITSNNYFRTETKEQTFAIKLRLETSLLEDKFFYLSENQCRQFYRSSGYSCCVKIEEYVFNSSRSSLFQERHHRKSEKRS